MCCLLLQLESCSQVYEQEEEKQIVSFCVIQWCLCLQNVFHDSKLCLRLRATLLQIRWDLIGIRITVDNLQQAAYAVLLLAFCCPSFHFTMLRFASDFSGSRCLHPSGFLVLLNVLQSSIDLAHVGTLCKVPHDSETSIKDQQPSTKVLRCKHNTLVLQILQLLMRPPQSQWKAMQSHGKPWKAS